MADARRGMRRWNTIPLLLVLVLSEWILAFAGAARSDASPGPAAWDQEHEVRGFVLCDGLSRARLSSTPCVVCCTTGKIRRDATTAAAEAREARRHCCCDDAPSFSTVVSHHTQQTSSTSSSSSSTSSNSRLPQTACPKGLPARPLSVL